MNSKIKKLRSVVMEMTDMLLCGVCDDLVKDVRQTTCGHYFCAECIEGHIRDKPKGQRSATCPIDGCIKGLIKASLKVNPVIESLKDHLLVLEDILGIQYDSQGQLVLSESSLSSGPEDSRTEADEEPESLLKKPQNSPSNKTLFNSSSSEDEQEEKDEVQAKKIQGLKIVGKVETKESEAGDKDETADGRDELEKPKDTTRANGSSQETIEDGEISDTSSSSSSGDESSKSSSESSPEVQRGASQDRQSSKFHTSTPKMDELTDFSDETLLEASYIYGQTPVRPKSTKSSIIINETIRESSIGLTNNHLSIPVPAPRRSLRCSEIF